ncbi:hypothetical protein HDV57DRAFT_269266 [Trichoderma longibrachiatum]|uniref:Uncharacterized protein n=1 Tax=Trichoderma longibrachiatum ATCC 18648 TaxID=983965 RepID=A0A2T4BPN7_TRILO|nr:hypothetical protein M440DRAFT_1151177 [Trichoderma longibrachiatum ATCC 18648]
MMDGCPTSAWNASVGSAIFSPSRGAQEDLRGVEGVSFALLLGPRSLHAEAGSLLSCLDKVSWCFAAGLGFFREGNAYQKDKTARSKGERAELVLASILRARRDPGRLVEKRCFQHYRLGTPSYTSRHDSLRNQRSPVCRTDTELGFNSVKEPGALALAQTLFCRCPTFRARRSRCIGLASGILHRLVRLALTSNGLHERRRLALIDSWLRQH